jgi:hypothetical protein
VLEEGRKSKRNAGTMNFESMMYQTLQWNTAIGRTNVLRGSAKPFIGGRYE